MYKSGFCTTQQAYNRAQAELYAALDELEVRLSKQRFLLGDKLGPSSSALPRPGSMYQQAMGPVPCRFTQADLWLLPTAARFDSVYRSSPLTCAAMKDVQL